MIRGIIFDMDNTLIQSKIDFKRMKSDILDFLVENQILSTDFSIEEHTTSTLIEYVRTIGISGEMNELMMARTAQHEFLGMKDAGLEIGAKEILQSLYGKFILVVITNNSVTAALEALENTGIARYFELIIGREMMSTLKPSPSGFHYAMNRCADIDHDEWISIGDSWIDGKAAEEAGIPFISYKADVGLLLRRGVKPTANINQLKELLDYL